ncbi:MAG: hypothetical protein H6779_02810 [Candidatus Nomurabacteria bacterium]|nr:hypothetical protein [Candidatus Nomurabacteria bacterium]USN87320.1 MAG: hypothetical protein H6779_02810 [Candidatus Nomurabacteria bacterium]
MAAKRRGEIVAVKDLFEKYRRTLQAPQKTVELEAVRVIGEISGLKLTEKQVKYTPASRTLAITASSLIKQELRFHCQAILEELKKRLGTKNAPQSIL